MISSAYKPASLGDLFKIGPALFSIHKSISHHALCAYGELEERRPPVLFGFEDILLYNKHSSNFTTSKILT